MTPFVWMFIKSYEKLREYIINNKSIATLVQMEYSAYEEATVPICSFVLNNEHSNDLGYYFRLSDFKGGMEVQKQKVLEALSNKECGYFYETSSSNFTKIPGSPIVYWFTTKFLNIFDMPKLNKYVVSKMGLQTSNNEKYLRLWYETGNDKFNKKWFPHNKGGEFRKWYGNRDFVVDWENNGYNLKEEKRKNYELGLIAYKNSKCWNEEYYFKNSLSWSLISSGSYSVRYYDDSFLPNIAAPSLFFESVTNKMYYILGFLNSNLCSLITKAYNPTINMKTSDIINLPFDAKYINNENIVNIVKNNIEISKQDWDSFETSWDFKVHPLVELRSAGASAWGDNAPSARISSAYKAWSMVCEERFNQLKANEEELNRIFIDIYGLQDELTPEVEDKDVTVRKADLVRDIRSFISYAVGCMFGRYSLDVEGLAYAGGEWDDSKYTTFIPDKDDIIPICDEEYFEDDIVSRFIEFVSVVYGSDTLEENLKFIADALGGKGTPREVLRNYFLNDFFKNHCKIYQKRPIYWLFDSGKKNGFKALVYIHRYTPDLIARMRTGYIHPHQARYRTQIELLQEQIDLAGSTSEKVKLSKQLKKINEQLLELNKYEEIVHHWADKMEPMDLDDGVKVNYAKFQELLAKIK